MSLKNMAAVRQFLASLFVLVVVPYAISIQTPKISVLQPQGIRFEIDDTPGTSLIAVHYSINNRISGTSPGRWNFDVRSKSGSKWIHENRGANFKPGDTVYYWIYAIVNDLGTQLLDKSWRATSSPSSGSGSNPSPPVSSSQGGMLNGRRLRLVFEDTFDSGRVDTSKWNYDVSMWGGGNNEFQTYTPLEQNTYIKNGALFIKPTLTTDKYGESFLYNGVWDMNREYGYCTVSSNYGCKREGKYGMLPPIMSGRLRSKGTIRYGKVEIIAKLPRGDWIWPALWMLSKDNKYGTWPRSGEIDIMEARGNRKFGDLGIEYMGSTLHWGSNWDKNKFAMTAKSAKVKKGPTLADGYHKFTLLWDNSGLEFLLDDDKIVKYSTPSQGYWRWGNLPGRSIWPTNDAPFDQEFYLIMNVAVGGTNGYIPDGVANEGYPKPWRNDQGGASQKFWQAKNKWYPTWKGEDAAMQVDSVRMWQLE